MKKSRKRWLIWFPIGIIISVALYFIVVILIAYITDYKPNANESIVLKTKNSEHSIPLSEHQFSLLSWNIGYCGLGKDQDFFYDGGSNVRPSSDQYQQYLNGIFHFLSKVNYLDFIFLQEIDLSSKRSYQTNQLETFEQALPNMAVAFAYNYKVKYVPLPIFEPMGKVEAGMASYARYTPNKADRIGFDVNFEWWKRIFMLDRCLITTRFKLASGKELILINIHNSAFDDENKLKPIELNTLKKLMLAEYSKGNFVVAGGDWNQNPPNFKPTNIPKQWNPTAISHPIASDLFPSDWKWVYAPNTPTERFNNQPFIKGKNKTTIIDFFLVSPNVSVQSVETFNLDFKFSDHQPILITFDIAPEISAEEEDL